MTNKEFDSKKDVREFWSESEIDEDRLDLLDSFYTHLTIDRILSVTDVTPQSRVLEVGGGWGRITNHMSHLEDIISIDITENLLQTQAELAPHASQIVSDAEQLPFPDNTFDFVYAVRILHYFDDIEPFISEFARVTKPEGDLVIVQPNKFNPYHQLTYYTKLLSPFTVKNAFRTAGVENTQIKYFGFSHPKIPIPQLERIANIPIIQLLSGLYLVHGEL